MKRHDRYNRVYFGLRTVIRLRVTTDQKPLDTWLLFCCLCFKVYLQHLTVSIYASLLIMRLQVHAVDAQMGGMRRAIECISITEDDKHAYCGTRTGDVLKFKIDRDDIRVRALRMCSSSRTSCVFSY